MNYIIVESTPFVASLERAKKISREIYNISRPLVIQEEYENDSNAFLVIEHPAKGSGAMLVDPNYMIKVHEKATLEKLVALFPELTPEEKMTLSSYALTQEAFPFVAILPQNTEMRDFKYMKAGGWFDGIDV